MSLPSPPVLLRFLRVLAIVWLIVACFLLLQLWPDIPQSKAQWFLFVGLGPPLYVLGEGFFAWLFSPAHGKAISDRTFSVSRIAVVLPIVLIIFVLCSWLSWLVSKP
jgi:hypothetical protein